MNTKRKLSITFGSIAILLMNVMCAVTAYSYRGMQCAVSHRGASAPAEVALLVAIPYIIAVAVCVALACGFYGASKKNSV